MIRIIDPSGYRTSGWPGGKTTELYIYPEDASYSGRNFDFRISTATVETEESAFTKLEGVRRQLAVLEGEMKLVFNGGREISLKPYEVCAFDGGWDTRSYGKVKDFNLMVARGNGTLAVRSVPGTYEGLYSGGKRFLYCPAGDICVKSGNESYFLKAGYTLLLEEEAAGTVFIIENRAGTGLKLFDIHIGG